MNIVEKFIELSQVSKALCAEIIGVSNNTIYNMIKQEKPHITIYQLEKMIDYMQLNKIEFTFLLYCAAETGNTLKFRPSNKIGFDQWK
jgi:hypothetical protein